LSTSQKTINAPVADLDVREEKEHLLRRVGRVYRWLGRIETTFSSLQPRRAVVGMGLLLRRWRRGLPGSVALVLWRLTLWRTEAASCAAQLPSVAGARLRWRRRVGLTGRIALLLCW
jgi:hypothetical protein